MNLLRRRLREKHPRRWCGHRLGRWRVCEKNVNQRGRHRGEHR